VKIRRQEKTDVSSKLKFDGTPNLLKETKTKFDTV
jgi:hypothetical protein